MEAFYRERACISGRGVNLKMQTLIESGEQARLPIPADNWWTIPNSVYNHD